MVSTNRSGTKDSFDYCISADNKIDASAGQVIFKASVNISRVFHFKCALSQPHGVRTKCESQTFHTMFDKKVDFIGRKCIKNFDLGQYYNTNVQKEQI